MEFIITFFRDILDGPLYIVVAVISVILICSCIGYLAETSLNKKKAKQEYDESHASVSIDQTTIPNQIFAENQTVVEASSIPDNNVQPNIASHQPMVSENIQTVPGTVIVESPTTNSVQQPIPELNSQQDVNIPKTMGTSVTPPNVITPPNSVDQIPKI